jgi:uncharacterized protein (TIGR02466 family)
MIITDTFSIFVAQHKLNLNLEDLIEFCVGNIDTVNNQPVRLGIPELQPLIKKASEQFNILHKQLGLSPNYHQEVVRVWFNAGYPDEIIKPHCHPESFFSGVFYVMGDETSGKISFMNPMTQKDSIVRPKMINNRNRYWQESCEIYPEPNLFLMFPGWLWHYVTPINGNVQRMSIAIDTEIRENK